MFSFPPNMDSPYRHMPKELNSNAFLHELLRDHRYDTSNSKDIVITKPCIRVTKQLLAYVLFTMEDSLNEHRMSKLYFLYSILEGDRLDPGSSLVNQLHSAASSFRRRIVIEGLRCLDCTPL